MPHPAIELMVISHNKLALELLELAKDQSNVREITKMVGEETIKVNALAQELKDDWGDT